MPLLPPLRLVTDRAPWDRLADESDHEYVAFLKWLHAESRRAPEASQDPLSLRHEWARRACAFDSSSRSSKSKRTRAQEIRHLLLEITLIEVRKLYAIAIGSSTQAVTVADLLRLAGVVAALPVEGVQDLDLSDLSDAELKAVADTARTLSRLSRLGAK